MSAIDSAAGLPLTISDRRTRHGEDIEAEVLELFDLMHVRLLRFALSLGLSSPDTEDIIQDTFLALFLHLQRGRSRDNLRAWLFKVVHNLTLRKLGKQNREVPADLIDPLVTLDPAPNPEQHMLVHEKHARLQAVLHALPSTDQLCLRLRAEGLRYREIAHIAGISLGAVSASLGRSIARLQEVERK